MNIYALIMNNYAMLYIYIIALFFALIVLYFRYCSVYLYSVSMLYNGIVILKYRRYIIFVCYLNIKAVTAFRIFYEKLHKARNKYENNGGLGVL